ncbi:hypothetical protein [Tenacibaculum litopenaei]|uniref:hypothetical protein n=1 Tax=Tenacibaculum litopenaei TaxID=396016 RepID=UPI0038B51DE8
MLDGVLLDASLWLCHWLIALVQFGLAGRWIGFPKGRECEARSNFGQPKAEFNPTFSIWQVG